ncbi:branched-chain alpha-ketoacid dehydrogenase [Lipomyces japonicus]|uniref:branched-chain alpha-ketoacid dehydrogenase n=1 Tax=Lipomyces japonicus TaxID=56871 RepID=UPI0034CF4026
MSRSHLTADIRNRSMRNVRRFSHTSIRNNSSVPISTVSSRHFYQNEALLDFASREPRLISLKQLAFFGRRLNDEKILQSANFVRQELPARMAHRIHDMQSLPYVVVSNPRISNIYELYYDSFSVLRKFPIIRTIEDNNRYCELLNQRLKLHTSIVPQLVMGVIECAESIESTRLDRFLDSILRGRISRRVITEQHLTMTDAFLKDKNFNSSDQIGHVFLQCHAKNVVDQCASLATRLSLSLHGNIPLPEIIYEGDVNAKFPYIQSHLRYIIGEILRNTFEASAERFEATGEIPSPVQVTISDSPDYVIFRFSDKAGGLPPEIVPYLWSFVNGPRTAIRHQNFSKVKGMEAIVDELEATLDSENFGEGRQKHVSSLSSLTLRSPAIRLGIGLPMSRIYAEFSGGKLSVKSLEGYGCDVFLHICKLGNEKHTPSV